ncbi:MAG: hypothetical protein IJQ16_07630 [Selenomonadaceae bacterium]|nr:hypothetical protein [Selenomonadaceae bacterium]
MKKVFIIIGGILLMFAIILGVTTCGILHVADEYIKEKEPEVRQYVQMTEADQNAYVEKNMDEIFMSISKEIKPDDKELDQAKLEQMKNDPELRDAGIRLGRSILASFAMGSENISKELNADDKAKYQAEADDLEPRIDAYGNALKKYQKEK